MSFEQAFYTSVESGLRGTRGFQISAASPGLSAELLEKLEGLGGYDPPPGAPERPTLSDLATFPVSLFYHRFEKHRAVVGQTQYVGTDYSGRFGNYFAHYLVVEDTGSAFSDCLPAQLWRSEDWKNGGNGSVTLDPLPQLPSRRANTLSYVEALLTNPDNARLLEPMVAAVQAAVGSRRRVLIVGNCDEVAGWIMAVTLLIPRSLSLDISFNTYVLDPHSTDALICGTSPDTIFTFNAFELSQQFFVFDLHGERSSSATTTPFAAYVSERTHRLGIEEGRGFARFADSMDACLGITELETALVCFRVAAAERLFDIPSAAMLRWVRKTVAQWRGGNLQTVMETVLDTERLVEPAEWVPLIEECRRVGGIARSVCEASVSAWMLLHSREGAVDVIHALTSARAEDQTIRRVDELFRPWLHGVRALREPARIAAQLKLAVWAGLLSRTAERATETGFEVVGPFIHYNEVARWLSGSRTTPHWDALVKGLAASIANGRIRPEANAPVRALLASLAAEGGPEHRLLASFAGWVLRHAREMSKDALADTANILRRSPRVTLDAAAIRDWLAAAAQAGQPETLLAIADVGLALNLLEAEAAVARDFALVAIGPQLASPDVRNFVRNLPPSFRASVQEGLARYLELQRDDDGVFRSIADFLRIPEINKGLWSIAEASRSVGLYCRLQEIECLSNVNERLSRFRECVAFARQSVDVGELRPLLNRAVFCCCLSGTRAADVLSMVEELDETELAGMESANRLSDLLADVPFACLDNRCIAAAQKLLSAGPSLTDMNRATLKAIAAAVERTPEAILLSVASWGDMRRRWQEWILTEAVARVPHAEGNYHLDLLLGGHASDPAEFLREYTNAMRCTVDRYRMPDRPRLVAQIVRDWTHATAQWARGGTAPIRRPYARAPVVPHSFFARSFLPVLASLLSIGEILRVYANLRDDPAAQSAWFSLLWWYPVSMWPRFTKYVSGAIERVFGSRKFRFAAILVAGSAITAFVIYFVLLKGQ